MRCVWPILVGCLLLTGCVSDGGYEEGYYETGYYDGGYYDGGGVYESTDWRYAPARRDIYWQHDHTTYYDPYPYHRYPYRGRDWSDRHRPDTDYRDEDRGRIRDRDQQPRLNDTVRVPEERTRDRRERPSERIDLDDRTRSRNDAADDIRRSRDREQTRQDPRVETRGAAPGDSDRTSRNDVDTRTRRRD